MHSKLIASCFFGCLMAFSGQALANEVVGGDLAFFCKTTNNKEVFVRQLGNTVVYSFGKPGAKPDIVLQRRFDQLPERFWTGVGSSISSYLVIPNGDYSYVLGVHVNRNSEEHEASFNLVVEKNDDEIATLQCDPKFVFDNRANVTLPW